MSRREGRLQRRGWLPEVRWSLLVAAIGAMSAGVPAAAAEGLTASELAGMDLALTPPSDWYEPPVLRSEKGVLNAALNIVYAENTLKIGSQEKRLKLRSYNGMLTGPTLRAKAGDTLRIHLRNDLPAEHEMEMTAECATPSHGFNTTNLHTHGLHISPNGNSDNVLLKIGPGGRQDYQLEILKTSNVGGKGAQHYPGTFWYHAHHHGATAVQLASGMAGALIIEGDVDEVPEIKAARERLFVFQQLAYDEKGVVEDFEEITDVWRAGKRHTNINGRVKPLFQIRPGEIERWRFIDAGIFEDLPIHLSVAQDGSHFDVRRIAIDGITLPAPEKMDHHPVELGPGYRTDLLVKAPAKKGTYYLYKAKSKFSLSGENPPPGVNDAQILAQIEVAGEDCKAGCAHKFPDKLPAPTEMLPDIQESELTNKNDPVFPKQVRFSLDNDGFFRVNETCFDEHKILPELQVKKGNVEEWVLINKTPMPHPFHIHVNAFQVLDKNGKPKEWRDTILVPPKGEIKIRTRFERFSGKFVLHCHILTHEDEGMMQLVEVKEK